MIALDCSAPATDPPGAPFGSGVKSVPHTGHCLPAGWCNHPAGYLRYPARWEPLVPEQLEPWCCPKYCGRGQSPQLGAFGTRSNNKISSFPRSSAARRESSCPLNQRGTDTRLVYLTKGSTGRLCLPVGGKAPNCRRTQHLILF
jgi:hypothetical protein